MTDGGASDASPVGIVLKGALGTAGGMVAGWVAGAFVCFLMDLAWSRGNAAYAYVIWFLVAAIAGFLALSTAGEWAVRPPEGRKSWIYRPDARRIALLLLAGGLVAVTITALLMRQFAWGDDPDAYYVPGSRPHSIAFLIGTAIGMLGTRQMAAMETKAGRRQYRD